jgi:hypothetical protein
MPSSCASPRDRQRCSIVVNLAGSVHACLPKSGHRPVADFRPGEFIKAQPSADPTAFVVNDDLQEATADHCGTASAQGPTADTYGAYRWRRGAGPLTQSTATILRELQCLVPGNLRSGTVVIHLVVPCRCLAADLLPASLLGSPSEWGATTLRFRGSRTGLSTKLSPVMWISSPRPRRTARAARWMIRARKLSRLAFGRSLRTPVGAPLLGIGYLSFTVRCQHQVAKQHIDRFASPPIAQGCGGVTPSPPSSEPPTVRTIRRTAAARRSSGGAAGIRY